MHLFKQKTDHAEASSGWVYGLNEWILREVFKSVG